ncbi:M20/M25/M40 family metallo-hydrolase [Thermogemmatispora sp.]|uniref:M20/M25/M40 family metallo-hydrolase n=1 Tax=Thermogemmatispora sp. TaxID=1968838 RepID=UPI001D68687A|nr:M20/M25/M40 family metallo-hydrolase [Thermogemmatispora sp.]MBX5449705.1 M20/M25/M40 family metallo-hydrolase [Thermogemmatispora sp.]
MSVSRLHASLVDLLALPSTSGHEEHVRQYLETTLQAQGLTTSLDTAGNLIALLPGQGRPVLLNAHMDRVPPGRGQRPILRDGVLYSDGSSNLGADDAAGLAIILEILRRLQEHSLAHPPIVALFTVQEESGLQGARAFDPTPWQVTDGIVFDNAFEAGVVVSRGAHYEAFDVEIIGRTGHPGKDLTQTVNALEIFRQAAYPHGSLANDQTRILIGHIEGGSARNAVPDRVLLQGELRSFEGNEQIEHYRERIRAAFTEAARQAGGQAKIHFVSHCSAYMVDEQEPLLSLYRQVLADRGEHLQPRPTFIGSDASALRPRVRAFTISTGVVNEHTPDEYVPLAPLEQLVEDTLEVLHRWSSLA